MDIFAFITFGLTFAMFAAAPGPGIAALVARALGSGMAATLPMIAGYVLGDLFFLTCAVMGLSVIAAKFGMVFTIVKFLGAAYLLFIAYRLWATKADATRIGVKSAESGWRMFIGGLAVTLGNPKVIVFYLALLPQFVELSALTLSDFAGLAFVIAIVLAGVLMGYVLLASKTRALLSNRSARKMLNRGTGAVMAGVAVAIVTR